MLSEYDSVAMALSQLDDWHTAAVPLITLIESLPRHRLDVIEAFLASTQQGITSIIIASSIATDRDITGIITVNSTAVGGDIIGIITPVLLLCHITFHPFGVDK